MVLLQKALRYLRYEGVYRGIREPGYCRILIIGVGGAGNNTINRLMKLGVVGARCVAVNTDLQHLNTIHADEKILIGEKITRGLGAGGDPSVGREAVKESIHRIEKLLEGCDIVFITAGLGGGTGTGAAPVIAEVARRKNAIVIGVVTIPFAHERGRMAYAFQGLNEMRRYAHTTVIIDNNKLMGLFPQLPIDQAFEMADMVLADMVRGIVETISLPSLINIDFADFRSIMKRGDVAIIGIGESDGPNRAEEATLNALNNLLLDVDYKGVDGALIHVSGDSSMTLNEAVRAAEVITSVMDEDSMVIWGARVDPTLRGFLKVSLVLTGVKSPYLFRGFEQAAEDIYNLEPYAKPESPLSVDLDLFQLERGV